MAANMASGRDFGSAREIVKKKIQLINFYIFYITFLYNGKLPFQQAILTKFL